MHSSDLQEESEFLQSRQKRREAPPHYWPADRVPAIGITYCELFQGIFGIVFLAMLGYVIFGVS